MKISCHALAAIVTLLQYPRVTTLNCQATWGTPKSSRWNKSPDRNRRNACRHWCPAKPLGFLVQPTESGSSSQPVLKGATIAATVAADATGTANHRRERMDMGLAGEIASVGATREHTTRSFFTA